MQDMSNTPPDTEHDSDKQYSGTLGRVIQE